MDKIPDLLRTLVAWWFSCFVRADKKMLFKQECFSELQHIPNQLTYFPGSICFPNLESIALITSAKCFGDLDTTSTIPTLATIAANYNLLSTCLPLFGKAKTFTQYAVCDHCISNFQNIPKRSLRFASQPR